MRRESARKPDGNFIVAWKSGFAPWAGGGRNGVFAREFDATGEPTGDEFQVDTPSPFHAPLDTGRRCRRRWQCDRRLGRMSNPTSISTFAHSASTRWGDKLGPLLLVSERHGDARRASAKSRRRSRRCLRGHVASRRTSQPICTLPGPGSAVRRQRPPPGRCVPGERRAARTRPPFSCDRSATQRTVRRRLDGGDGRFVSRRRPRPHHRGFPGSVRSDSMPPPSPEA